MALECWLCGKSLHFFRDLELLIMGSSIVFLNKFLFWNNKETIYDNYIVFYDNIAHIIYKKQLLR